MRDVKRERYGAKELVKLKQCAARLQQTKDSGVSPAESSSLFQLVTPASAIKAKPTMDDVEMNMDQNTGKPTKSFGKTDENGQYPVWMSVRNVKRLKKKNEKKKVQKRKNKAKK